MATFDGPTTTITLDVPVGDTLEVDVKTLYSEWKRWLKTGDNAKYLPAFRVVGGDPLTPGVNAGTYYFLQNQNGWRVVAGNKDQTIFYNGNLVPEDSSIEVISETPGFTVAHLGLQPITQNVESLLINQQTTSFGGMVALDPSSSVTGTDFPKGTLSTPVNNLNDLFAIAQREGIKSIKFSGTVTLDRDVSGYTWEGAGTLFGSVIVLNNQLVNRCKFSNCTLTGVQNLSSPIEARYCNIASVNGLHGVYQECGFTGTNSFSTLSTDPTTECIMNECFSAIGGTGTPIFDATGVGPLKLSVRSWDGGFELINQTSPDFEGTLGMQNGNPKIGPTNTAGTLVIRGRGQTFDTINPNGMTVITSGYESPEEARTARSKILKAIRNILPI